MISILYRVKFEMSIYELHLITVITTTNIEVVLFVL